MNRAVVTIAALTMTLGAAQAQSLNAQPNGSGSKDGKTVGATGAMGNANANGVATDPQGVAEQQKGTTKSSPGTVGAAPGGDVPSQKPDH